LLQPVAFTALLAGMGVAHEEAEGQAAAALAADDFGLPVQGQIGGNDHRYPLTEPADENLHGRAAQTPLWFWRKTRLARLRRAYWHGREGKISCQEIKKIGG